MHKHKKNINLGMEIKLLSGNYRSIAGIDEAGRGSWAGPIVAGIIVIKNDDLAQANKIKKIVKDSKILNHRQRLAAFEILTANFCWSAGIVSQEEIDNLGVQTANKIVMEKAINNLGIIPDFVLIDGSQIKINYQSQNIIDGDNRIFSIAAASIIAKVIRDKILIELDKIFPHYYWKTNKGYGTKQHQKALKKYGYSIMHRQSFKPISEML